MAQQMKSAENDIYIQTAAVAGVCRELFSRGKLAVGSEDEALALGREFVAARARAGAITEDWEDFAHVDLLDHA